MEIHISLELVAKDAIEGVERGDVIVVIDVFRCSSTVITCLANEAASLIPVETLREHWNFGRAIRTFSKLVRETG